MTVLITELPAIICSEFISKCQTAMGYEWQKSSNPFSPEEPLRPYLMNLENEPTTLFFALTHSKLRKGQARVRHCEVLQITVRG
jgi:hypothetical protein